LAPSTLTHDAILSSSKRYDFGFDCVVADPGIFEFEKPSFLIKESVGMAQIPVTRANGCDGRVAVQWVTKDLTAVSGQDYSGGEGSLVFEHGETAKMIDITIHNDLVSYSRFALYSTVCGSDDSTVFSIITVLLFVVSLLT